MTINNYRIIGDFSSDSAGFSRWAFCEKNSKKYFIKEFLSPVYPEASQGLSPATIAKRRAICDEFIRKRIEFYNKLYASRTGNIVIVLDFFRYGGKYYMVTEVVEGVETGLQTVVSSDYSVKLTLIRSILYSVDSFHRAGIVHSDIKAANMLIKRTKIPGYLTAKIIDFDSGFIIGEPPADVHGDLVYLAPEAYERMCDKTTMIDEKIDIFALGILFHQYWCGELPKIDKSCSYVFEAVDNDLPVILSERIPKNICGIISTMLRKYPAARPGAAELLTAFSALT